jgi:3',5'-nucleoside bisphosphate phosphatase
VSFDLHTHSRWSDGTTTPGTNAALAARAGLLGVALTDHDDLGGWPEMAEACAHRRIEFVPGIELSTRDCGRSVHLLGYWVNPDDEPLVRHLALLRATRERRAAEMLEKLHDAGIAVTLERVRAVAGGAPLGRLHIAAALVEISVVRDVQEAFDRWIGEGCPAYVPTAALTPERGATLIMAAGGVAVLAHPERSGVDEDLLDRLAGAGIAAVEADHPNHDKDVALRWRHAACERGLLITGSSDFHGTRKTARIGERTTPDHVVEALRAQKGRGRTPGPSHTRQEVRSW